MLRQLGLAVRDAREASGISQRELARRSGLTRQHIGQIEFGRVDPSYSVMLQLTRALDMRLADLVAEAQRRATA